MNITYPRHPDQSKWDPRTRTLPERNGHCFYCGKKLTGRQLSWCCLDHSYAYAELFYWGGISMRVFHRDNHCCRVCGKNVYGEDWEIDHVLAICLGGDAWDENNLQLLCVDCHKKKTRSDLRKLVEKRRGFISENLMDYVCIKESKIKETEE